jgi:hypothetical protein
MVNGADSGTIDEEAERKSFQEAVMQWRQGTSSTEKGGANLLVGTDTTGEQGQWSNPFGGDAKASVSVSVTSGVGMNGTPSSAHSDDMVIMSARSNYDPQDEKSSSKSLANGVLDEEKERKEFQDAVNAWRTGEEKPSKNKAIADKLAQQMDDMHQESSAKLKADQYNMIQKIQKVQKLVYHQSVHYSCFEYNINSIRLTINQTVCLFDVI